MDIATTGAEVHEAVCRGALRGLGRAIASLQQDGSELASAWSAAIAGARALVDAEAKHLPADLEALRAFVGAPVEVRRVASTACVHLERAALVGWDAAELRAIAALHRELLAADKTPDGHIERSVSRVEAWIQLLEGDVAGLEAIGKRIYAEGASAQDASLVIDATLLRAMAALTKRDADDAKALARRASRMARTEGLRPERYLASIVLARVRRRGARPHLATRILSAIIPIAPPRWQGWLRWERLLAGWRPGVSSSASEVREALALAPDTPSSRAARGLVEWLAAASEGNAADVAAARAGVAKETAQFDDMAQEQVALAACLDPSLDADGCPDVVVPWVVGDDDDTPAGLHGIVGNPDGPADSTIACVVCRPDRKPRRILRIAVPLIETETEIIRLQRTRLRRGRVDTAVAALALAGPEGLPDPELFERAYEFEFVPALHAGILDVLVHRMRARLDTAATVHRKSGRLRLEPHGTLVLPDPRCVEHVEDRLLRVIARHGGVTTRQAAQELDVSVRTAQLALRRLLASGDCVLNRDGRRVQYIVEDTTFTEPTRF